MSEPVTRCIDCNAAIKPETVERRRGRCVRCYLLWKSMPPPDAGIRRDIYERLVALGINPIPYLQNTQPSDEANVVLFIEKEERHLQLYRKWAPQLRAYSSECRRLLPLPRKSELSQCDREKQRVLQTVLSQPGSVRNKVAICLMPLLAIALAHELWPMQDPNVVYLTPQEHEAWLSLHPGCEVDFEWYAFYRLDLEVPMVVDNRPMWSPDELQAGEQPWLVSHSQAIGSGGHAYADLWIWNGETARKLRRAWHLES